MGKGWCCGNFRKKLGTFPAENSLLICNFSPPMLWSPGLSVHTLVGQLFEVFTFLHLLMVSKKMRGIWMEAFVFPDVRGNSKLSKQPTSSPVFIALLYVPAQQPSSPLHGKLPVHPAIWILRSPGFAVPCIAYGTRIAVHWLLELIWDFEGLLSRYLTCHVPCYLEKQDNMEAGSLSAYKSGRSSKESRTFHFFVSWRNISWKSPHVGK